MSYGLWNQPPPIRVYPANATTFENNGLRCLFPQSAEVTLREQQAHSIHLVHPVDDDGAWKSLQLHNILYVPIEKRGVMTFQPMRIYKIQKQRQNGGKLSITVDAKHVFYDLNSVLIQTCTISAAACQAAIGSAFSAAYRPTENAQACDAFSYSSDISTTASAQYENITLTAALIGNDNSIASLYGGELYVDGFRFSINSRMEGAIDNAFALSYAINMTGITATYDADAQYSAVVGSSGTATQTRISSAATVGLPFDRTIYAKFSYKSGTPAQQFSDDLDKYADTAKQVNASYQVTFADLNKFDEYGGFDGLSTFEVGDTGTVYDEFLDILTNQKIVEKKIDVLTQTVLSVTLGSVPASITLQSRFASTVTNNTTADQKAQSALASAISGEQSEITTQNDAIIDLIDSGAKNMLHVTDVGGGTAGGCVYTVNSDGTVSVDVSGKTGVSYMVLRLNGTNIVVDDYCNGNYVLSGCPSGGGSGNGNYRMYAAKSTYAVYDYGNGAVLPSNGSISGINVVVYIGADYSGGNLTFKPMICKKSYWDISKKYVPYKT